MAIIKPKVILFLEDERALNYRYKLNYTLNRSIEVKSIDYDLNKFKNDYQLIGGEPDNNSLYFLHPYKENAYVREKKGEVYFLKEKLNLYKKFASMLGATDISANLTLEKTSSIETKVNGEVEYKVLESSVEHKKNKETKYKNSLELHETYELQHNYDKSKNLEKLRNLIYNYDLHHEQDLISLIEARDSSQTGTQLKNHKVKSEITSEFNNLLEVSAQLNSPVFDIGGSFEKKLQDINSVIVEMNFKFD